MTQRKQLNGISAPWRGAFYSMFLTCLVGAFLAGCSSMEYAIREQFGQQKREILVDRVDDARESQEEAKEQFVDALTSFKAVTGFEGGELESKYDQLKDEFEKCSKRAETVTDRIDAVEDVAGALFREWEDELDQYSSQELRRVSERQLRDTQVSYEQLIKTMRIAESRMKPVLDTFRDQVLFLKHNLNARAVASLGNISVSLERDIDVLVADMQKAIDDANRFITDMQSSVEGG